MQKLSYKKYMSGKKKHNFNISQEQCKFLASYFYKDIAKYVEENQAKYLQFVKSIVKKGENNDKRN